MSRIVRYYIQYVYIHYLQLPLNHHTLLLINSVHELFANIHYELKLQLYQKGRNYISIGCT